METTPSQTQTREQPWHLRRANAKHEQAFRNLVEFNELTNAWLSELRSDQPKQLLTRGLSADVTENLWMLESLSETPLQALLDDTAPEDTLARLDYTVWAVQAWTLAGLLDRTPKSDFVALESQLNQISWKVGRACAERRWKRLAPADRGDLNLAVQTIRDTPILASASLGSNGGGDPLLIRRAIPSEVILELRFCPHRSTYPEIHEPGMADTLCALHSQWMRGFAYGLHSRIGIETTTPERGKKGANPSSTDGDRCLQRWFFL